MGAAPEWQGAFGRAFADCDDLTLLNPRRDDWDSSWRQRMDDPRFRGQVEWELEGQERADVIAMYFALETKAPITLLELGLFARSGKVVVGCPEGYWRLGNVEVVCQRYGVPLVGTLDALIERCRERVAG
jgi:hypothetical protein